MGLTNMNIDAALESFQEQRDAIKKAAPVTQDVPAVPTGAMSALAFALSGLGAGLTGNPALLQQTQGVFDARAANRARVREVNQAVANQFELTRAQSDEEAARAMFDARVQALIEQERLAAGQTLEETRQAGATGRTTLEQEGALERAQISSADLRWSVSEQGRQAMERLLTDQDFKYDMFVEGREAEIERMLLAADIDISNYRTKSGIDWERAEREIKLTHEKDLRRAVVQGAIQSDLLSQEGLQRLREIRASAAEERTTNEQMFRNRLTELRESGRIDLANKLEIIDAQWEVRREELATMSEDRMMEMIEEYRQRGILQDDEQAARINEIEVSNRGAAYLEEVRHVLRERENASSLEREKGLREFIAKLDTQSLASQIELEMTWQDELADRAAQRGAMLGPAERNVQQHTNDLSTLSGIWEEVQSAGENDLAQPRSFEYGPPNPATGQRKSILITNYKQMPIVIGLLRKQLNQMPVSPSLSPQARDEVRNRLDGMVEWMMDEWKELYVRQPTPAQGPVQLTGWEKFKARLGLGK